MQYFIHDTNAFKIVWSYRNDNNEFKKFNTLVYSETPIDAQETLINELQNMYDCEISIHSTTKVGLDSLLVSIETDEDTIEPDKDYDE